MSLRRTSVAQQLLMRPIRKRQTVNTSSHLPRDPGDGGVGQSEEDVGD